jgi:hypothetical protein
MTKVDGTYTPVIEFPEYYGERTGKSFGFEGKIRSSFGPISGHVWTRVRHV